MKVCILIFTVFIYFIFWLIIFIKLYWVERFYNFVFSMMFWVPFIMIIVGTIAIIKKIFQYQELENRVNLLKEMDDIKEKQKINMQLSILNDDLRLKNNVCQLQKIETMLKYGEYETAKNEFQHIYDDLKSINTINYCNNAYLNAIFHHKKSIAEQLDIFISYDIRLPEHDDIDIVDLPTIVFNILDNGIEASKKSSNKYIYLSIKYNDKYISIYQKNSNNFQEKEDIQGFHGYGLMIIEEIVEKYEGSCEWNNIGEYFESKIMIKYQKEDSHYEDSNS